jgi:hypothetical protein
MTPQKQRLVRLLDRLADLYPDVCERVIGFSWRIVYGGKVEIVFASDTLGLKIPPLVFAALDDLLQPTSRALSLRPVTGFAAIDTFEAYLVELEKKNGLYSLNR